MDHKRISRPAKPGLRRFRLAGLLLLASTQAWATCDSNDPLRIALSVISDRGDPHDREQRIELHASGCLAVRRPPAFREPGLHIDHLPAAELADLRARLDVDVLGRAESLLARRKAQGAAAGDAPAHYISHPTRYRITVADDQGAPPTELRFESVLQLSDLHPESVELTEVAKALRAILALDRRPGLRAETTQ